MATLVVTYPAAPGGHFDRDYYVNTHLKLCEQHFGPAGMTGAQALFPLTPDAPWFCVGLLTFKDAESIGAAMQVPGAAEVMGDIPKFTSATPAAVPMA